ASGEAGSVCTTTAFVPRNRRDSIGTSASTGSEKARSAAFRVRILGSNHSNTRATRTPRIRPTSRPRTARTLREVGVAKLCAAREGVGDGDCSLPCVRLCRDGEGAGLVVRNRLDLRGQLFGVPPEVHVGGDGPGNLAGGRDGRKRLHTYAVVVAAGAPAAAA